MSDNLELGMLNDNQVEDLRNHLRGVVAGMKDPGSTFLDVILAAHGSTTHNSVKTDPPPVDPCGCAT